MIPQKKIEISPAIKYTMFARAYLILSYRGTEEVLKKIKTGKHDNPFGKLAPDMMYEVNFLLAPILFNLKHAIEIFLKGLIILNEQEFEKKHDIDKLFKKLLKRTNKENLKKYLLQLKPLIKKYHQNNFLKDKIKINFTIEDKLNDVFRYPDNKANLQLDFIYIFNRFNEKDIKEIQQDLQALSDSFYNIGYTSLIGKGAKQIKTPQEAESLKQEINRRLKE